VSNTPPRSVRVSDALWNAARDLAQRRGVTLTDVIVNALQNYVSDLPRRKDTTDGPR
jgi:hypothetical protein